MLPEAKTGVPAIRSSMASFSLSPPPDSTLDGESGNGEGEREGHSLYCLDQPSYWLVQVK